DEAAQCAHNHADGSAAGFHGWFRIALWLPTVWESFPGPWDTECFLYVQQQSIFPNCNRVSLNLYPPRKDQFRRP
ncbi:MAG TPA: hypothetical protein VNH18_33560, partial [Bryobacteraceae bacterium]|nr:hypothetical protein [Bryobacteraceae bacterium]